MQVFPQTPNSLACFSVNSKNTQWGNVSKKRIHLLPPRLVNKAAWRGLSGSSAASGRGALWSDSPTGQRAGISPGWQLPCRGEERGREEARGAEGDKHPFLAGFPDSCGEARAVGQHIPSTADVLLL